MKKYTVLFIVFIFMVGMIYFINRNTTIKEENLLNNNVMIEGIVSDIKISDNHMFGIILLKVNKANVKEFKGVNGNSLYPYSKENGHAELYTSIPDGLNKGDEVIINSNKLKEVYFCRESNQRVESTLQMVTNDINIRYVKTHTIFK